jgi:hypothetical protein
LREEHRKREVHVMIFREVEKLKKRWRKAEKGRIDKDTDR